MLSQTEPFESCFAVLDVSGASAFMRARPAILPLGNALVQTTQIMHLLADARQKQGDSFSLQAFHDFVWTNGNVPISLQRWELLNEPSDVPPIPDFVSTPN